MVSGNIIMDNIQNKWYYHSTDKTNIVLSWQHVQKPGYYYGKWPYNHGITTVNVKETW